MSVKDKKEAAECIVIGAGVIGCSIAYHLAKDGRRTILLERSCIGGDATGAAAGMLAAESEEFSNPAMRRFALHSRNMYPSLIPELEDLSGISTGYRKAGFVIPVKSRDQLESWKRSNQHPWSESSVWWDAEELFRKIPAMDRRAIGAIHRPEETQLVPLDLTRAYAKAAVQKGAVIMENTQVDQMIIRNGKLRGIESTKGFLSCEQAVIAGGLRSEKLLAQAGLTIPMYPVKGEVAAVQLPNKPLEHTIYAEDIYLVPKPGNELWIGATSIPHVMDRSVTPSGLQLLLERATGWLPCIQEASFLRAWAGLRPQTVDGLPYMGKAPQAEGIYAAVGHFRNGILLSAATGEAMAAMLRGVSASDLGIEIFSEGRDMEVGECS